ncbi:MtN3-like protein [Phytophthora cinnamomi]|uniref:MtN3-like protein n=1 Tax=Phytophthora cinnamomi TaxID=4785 RepID=UPI003559EF51|nr:MtN3-like protein [Phytophthora cinnamomi]
MLALSIVNVATTISSVALCLSPYPDFHRIHKTKRTGEVRILPMIMLCCNSTMWGLYGVAIESYFPVVSINVFGALVATAFVAVFYRYDEAGDTHQVLGFTAGHDVGLCIKNRPEPEVDDAEDTSSIVGISIVEDVGPQSSPTKKVQFAPNSEAAVITFAPASSYEDFETPRPA